VSASTQASSTKIKTENWNTGGIERFRRLVDNFIVQCAAKEWMRMADDRRECWRRRTQGSPENRFETPRRPLQKKSSGIVSSCHVQEDP
jgi:hypothetical protein